MSPKTILLITVTLLAVLLPTLYGLTSPAYSDGSTLVAMNGLGTTLGLLAIPVILVSIAVFSPYLAVEAAVLLAIFAFLSGASIGLYYLPGSVLAIITAGHLKDVRERRTVGIAPGR